MITSYEIDWSSDYSLHNWVGQMDLMCCPKWKIGMLGTCIFSGYTTSLLWMPRLSDKYTRKTIFAAGAVFDLCLLIALLGCKSIDSMIVLCFLIGVAIPSRYHIGFVYLMELLPKSKQNFYGAFVNTFNVAGLMLAALYFRFVSKQWTYFCYLSIFMQVVCVVGTCFLPESPRLLIEHQRLDEAEQSLKTIARWGRYNDDSGQGEWQFNKDEFTRRIDNTKSID